MPKTFTDRVRTALNGPTMGTRWSLLFHRMPGFETAALEADLQAAVDSVDRQMSTWRPDSDLNRLNAAPVGVFVDLPEPLMTVLAAGLAIGRASGGAFDIGMGDAVAAWGFRALPASETAIRAARARTRQPAHALLELDLANRRARKHADLRLDLDGIAKGYGVDCLAQTARRHGVTEALAAIDGELVALGSRPDGSGWPVAIERPDLRARAVHSLIALEAAAIATSGDYRHVVTLGDRRLSHTIDPRRGMPLADSPASVSVVACDAMTADAWATAMMVMGPARGLPLARALGLSVLFLRDGADAGTGTGLFAERPEDGMTPGHDSGACPRVLAPGDLTSGQGAGR